MTKTLAVFLSAMAVSTSALALALTSGWQFNWSKDCYVKYESIAGAPVVRTDVYPCKPHYLVKKVYSDTRSAIASGAYKGIEATLEIRNGAALRSIQDGGSQVYATLFFQHKDDNMTGQGKYAHYRQWANRARIRLIDGTYSVRVPFDRTQWTGVFGANASLDMYRHVLRNMGKVGITYGGVNDFGHGIRGNGDVYIKAYNFYTD